MVPNPSCGGSACAFNFTYGSSSVAASVVQDTLTLATDPIPSYTFGCVQKQTGPSAPQQGLLGLGRGPLSLLAQTQNLYKSTFSYCLPSFKSSNFSGSLRLGPVAQPKRIKYTPLLRNPRRSSLYYVNLVAIKVGRKIVDIPPAALAFNPTTGAGTIFDSGTVFTRLVEPVYTADNILIHSTAGSTTCLAMAAAPDNVNSVLNVIANLQQQNHRVLFDVPNSRLGVAREICT
ncbi:aspartic proteinase nepenthesin-1-like protein [Trifolium pratense]|uniref:Aspartic proteinase nepenthesin-1-like protein n=1 Tax=Trifolium pratense TaxID=57577 RepID=A0A2K3LBF2_TRIPR|nr:aspartic proteinase nepenthesin-1-like protein [Trifolium pratense]